MDVENNNIEENNTISFFCQHCGLIWRSDRLKYKMRYLKSGLYHKYRWIEYSSPCPICERIATNLVSLPEITDKFTLPKGLK